MANDESTYYQVLKRYKRNRKYNVRQIYEATNQGNTVLYYYIVTVSEYVSSGVAKNINQPTSQRYQYAHIRTKDPTQ